MSARNKDGYGVTGDNKLAHRFICELFHGPMTKTQNACHSCDNPPCCNPAHLWPGTNLQNHQDSAAKRRSTYGEKNPGAKLNEKQVRIIKSMSFEIFTFSEIAELLHCKCGTVGRIVSGQQWKHVE
jgi:hypothetical protein